MATMRAVIAVAMLVCAAARSDQKALQPDSDLESDNALFSQGSLPGDVQADSDAALYAGVAAEQPHIFVSSHGDSPSSESDNALYAASRLDQGGHTDGDADSESDAALFGGGGFIQTSDVRIAGSRGKMTPDVPATMPEPEIPEVFPVPTTSRCIVIMCCQYMIIYFALAVCRTYHEVRGTAKGSLEAGLRGAAQTVTYGPMLCVLFIACRMRVEFLSGGKDQPQLWVQHCMYFVTYSVLLSAISVMVIPMMTGKPLALKEGTCDLERPELEEGGSKVTFYVLTLMRYLILAGLYGGLVGIIVGMCTYMPPGETDLRNVPMPAPAVMCTMILAVVFFLIQLVIAGCRTYEELKGTSFPKVAGVMNAAATTVEFAPMLAILFLAARMRALQHQGQPQEWAQSCMYIATVAMCVATLLAIVVPLTLNGTMKTNPHTMETTLEVPDPVIGYFLMLLRYLCMSAFYACTAVVAYSVFVFVAPGGPEATLPVSPTVQCVVNMTCQFFFVYTLMTVMLTVQEVSGGRYQMETYKLFSAIESSKATLAFAPMLSILFVTTRMYALLITDNKGAPAAWVQDGMFMATWSLLISFVSCLFTGFFMEKVETDEDGNVINKFENQYIALVMTALRYFTMALLYGGMITVIVGLFVMTPETANGRGSIPLVTDAVNATPIGNAPPGPNNAAKTATDAGDAATGTAGKAVGLLRTLQ